MPADKQVAVPATRISELGKKTGKMWSVSSPIDSRKTSACLCATPHLSNDGRPARPQRPMGQCAVKDPHNFPRSSIAYVARVDTKNLRHVSRVDHK